MINFEQHQFNNGLRLIHIANNSLVAHFGVVLGMGSRDELPHEHGIAHFIEHMLFKGTVKRKPYHILSRMEDIGGEIDAYTDKEFIVFGSSFPKQYFERAVELISDILFRSIFPEKEIIKEKEVISEEISMYKDTPSELIFDFFDEMLFGEHPMGRNILGTEKSLKKINRSNIHNYLNRKMLPQQTVICSAGNITISKAAKLIEKYFACFPVNQSVTERIVPPLLKPQQKIIKKHTCQAHCIIGQRSLDARSLHRIKMHLITNILGGPSLNSRLNLLLREKFGLVYQVDASYSSFSDCGTFGVYFGADKNNLEICQNLVIEEIKKISRQKLGTMQMHNLKRQITGQTILSVENKMSRIISAAKSLLIFDRVWTIEQIIKAIELTTSSDLLEIAAEQFYDFEPAIIIIQ